MQFPIKKLFPKLKSEQKHANPRKLQTQFIYNDYP